MIAVIVAALAGLAIICSNSGQFIDDTFLFWVILNVLQMYD